MGFIKALLSNSKDVSSKRFSGISLIILSVVLVFLDFSPDYYTPFLLTGGGLLGIGQLDHWSDRGVG
jgi:hypothetical protein